MLALLVLVACKQAWLSLVGGTLASSEGEGALHNLGIIFPIINAGRFLGCSAQMKESDTLEINFHCLEDTQVGYTSYQTVSAQYTSF